MMYLQAMNYWGTKELSHSYIPQCYKKNLLGYYSFFLVKFAICSKMLNLVHTNSIAVDNQFNCIKYKC